MWIRELSNLFSHYHHCHCPNFLYVFFTVFFLTCFLNTGQVDHCRYDPDRRHQSPKRTGIRLDAPIAHRFSQVAVLGNFQLPYPMGISNRGEDLMNDFQGARRCASTGRCGSSVGSLLCWCVFFQMLLQWQWIGNFFRTISILIIWIMFWIMCELWYFMILNVQGRWDIIIELWFEKCFTHFPMKSCQMQISLGLPENFRIEPWPKLESQKKKHIPDWEGERSISRFPGQNSDSLEKKHESWEKHFLLPSNW